MFYQHLSFRENKQNMSYTDPDSSSDSTSRAALRENLAGPTPLESMVRDTLNGIFRVNENTPVVIIMAPGAAPAVVPSATPNVVTIPVEETPLSQ